MTVLTFHKFIYQDDERYIEARFQDKDYLPDVLACFQQYLAAVGFCFELGDELIIAQVPREPDDAQESCCSYL